MYRGGGLNQSALCSSTKTMIVLMVAITVGYIAGNIIRSNSEDSYAASANITVINNNQIVTQEQGKTSITKTSNVAVRDTAATYGYNLSARISQNTLPAGTTVQISSNSSSECPTATPCSLVTGSAPVRIHKTYNSTLDSGESKDWQVTITIPENTSPGNYILDIEYSEEARVPLTAGMNMQDATQEHCDATKLGTTLYLRDSRDSTQYRVKKMVDGRCWMVDNLAYNINSAPATGKPNYYQTPELDSTPNGTPNLTSVATKAQYAQNTAAFNIPNNGTSKASYLYNWCAAMGDESQNCSTTANYLGGQPTIPVVGVCPGSTNGSGFRLPRGGSSAANGNEFALLNVAMGSTGTYAKWMGTSAATDNWYGVLGGLYSDGLVNQGYNGNTSSATASSNQNMYMLNLGNGSSAVSPANSGNLKQVGLAVRCVLGN